MPIPQVTDRIKEAPAVALRAVFAGVGQLLMVVDKIRAQMQEQATSSVPTARKGPGPHSQRGGRRKRPPASRCLMSVPRPPPRVPPLRTPTPRVPGRPSLSQRPQAGGRQAGHRS